MTAVNGTPVFVSTYGRAVLRGARTAVLVHGAGMDQSVWTLQGRYLAFHGWNALAVDLPGHGRARGQAALATIEAMADWLAGTLGPLADAPAAVIGHSMGALVALELAARHPDRVGSLALLGAGLAMPVHHDLLAAAARHDPLAVDLITDWAFGRRGHVGGNLLPGGWMMGTAKGLLLRGDPAVLSGDLAACAAYAGGAAAATAARCPALVVIGAEDRMAPPAAGAALAAALADSRSTTIEDAGHMMMVESPEATLQALRGFLG
jgi:pimeloyl-ACP methyl ester carboxylesterase